MLLSRCGKPPGNGNPDVLHRLDRRRHETRRRPARLPAASICSTACAAGPLSASSCSTYSGRFSARWSRRSAIRSTGFLFDGQLAVCVFFVLSGEALSAAFFAGKGDASTIRLAIKRYPRLATPILAASFVVFALDRLGLVFSREAALIVHRADWMGGWLPLPPTFADTLRYSLVDVFTSAGADHAINPMLWTMRVELPGSFIVFAILLIWKRFSRPRLLLLGLFVVAMAAPTGSTANYLVVLLRRRRLRRLARPRRLRRLGPTLRLGFPGGDRRRRRGGRGSALVRQ